MKASIENVEIVKAAQLASESIAPFDNPGIPIHNYHLAEQVEIITKSNNRKARRKMHRNH